MKLPAVFTLVHAALALSGCAILKQTPGISPIHCTYRFKMLSRPEDQARVEAAISAVAVGPVAKSGTVSYPEYRFRVARLADLDKLNPRLLYSSPRALFAGSRDQTINLKAAEIGRAHV